MQVGAQSGQAREALQTAVTENFLPDAALRLVRTAQVIDVALGREDGEDSEGQAIFGGRLSAVELRAILPWLLRQDGLTADSRFWRRLGDLFDLRLLEQVADSIDGADLGHLLRANANKWTCRRAYVGLAVDDDGEASTASGLWRFRGGVLGVDFGGRRISLASSGRTLPGRHSTGDPHWDVLSDSASSFRLVSSTLRGISRSISITAEESDDVRSDVEGVVNSIEDSFVVSEMVVRVPDQPSGDAVDVTLSFSRATATAEPAAAIRDMVRAAGRLLAFRDPLSEEEVAQAVAP